MNVKEAVFLTLVGKILEPLPVDELKLLTPLQIQTKLLHALNTEKDHDSRNENTNVDRSCQTTSIRKNADSTPCDFKQVPICKPFAPPNIENIEGTFKDSGITTMSMSESFTSHQPSSEWEPEHANVFANSNTVVAGTLHYLNLILEMKQSNTSSSILELSQKNETLLPFRSMFDIERGLNDLLCTAVALKRSKLDHNRDFHDYIVATLRNVCATDVRIRGNVVLVLENLLKSSSTDEKDLWCVSLLIEDLSEKNNATSLLLLGMIFRLLSTAVQNSLQKNDSSEVLSTFCFCLFQNLTIVLNHVKCHSESCSDESSMKTLVKTLQYLKFEFEKVFVQLNTNHNLVVVSHHARKVVSLIQDSVDCIELKSLAKFL